MGFDPNIPADHSQANAAQMRGQLNALKALIDAQQATIEAQRALIDGLQTQINDVRALANRCAFVPSLTILDAEFHDPPTEADLEVVRNYVNDMAGQLQGGW
jgi:multidrug resistance efflux pump